MRANEESPENGTMKKAQKLLQLDIMPARPSVSQSDDSCIEDDQPFKIYDSQNFVIDLSNNSHFIQTA